MSSFFDSVLSGQASLPPTHVKVSTRAFRKAIEETLISGYTRIDLENVLHEELQLEWTQPEDKPSDTMYSKRDVIRGYTDGWTLPSLVGLARRLVQEMDLSEPLLSDLTALRAEYDKGGGSRFSG